MSSPRPTPHRNARGVTADHYVCRHIIHGACTADYIWVDEISQVDIEILCQLNKLTFTKLRWLLSGDFNSPRCSTVSVAW